MDDDRNIKCEDCSNRDASTVKCKSVYEKQNPVTVKKNPPLAQLDRWRSIYKDSAITDVFTLRRRETLHESLIHGVTTHNWFANYIWNIYGGFGHNGKIIQRTLPSHTQPSRSKLTVWASF